MTLRQTAATTLVQTSVVAVVVLLLMLMLRATPILLVIFGGMLLAVLFHHAASWISLRTRLGHGWALTLAILLPLAALSLGAVFAAPAVANQASELADRIPAALQQLQQQARQIEGINRLLEQQDRLHQLLPSSSQAASALATFFGTAFGALGNLLFAFVLGLFLAATPRIYVEGLLRLVPPAHRLRSREVLNATGQALAAWILAKLAAMAVIGVLTTVGLWMIGIDLALVLGLIAAVLSFVPNFGPIASAVPAVLIALVGGIDQVLYVVLLYAGIQTFESYLLTPMLQQRAVDLPPALLLSMQVLFGVLAGVLGLILATPLTAAALVMIRMWYVEDLLGDRQDQEDEEAEEDEEDQAGQREQA